MAPSARSMESGKTELTPGATAAVRRASSAFDLGPGRSVMIRRDWLIRGAFTTRSVVDDPGAGRCRAAAPDPEPGPEPRPSGPIGVGRPLAAGPRSGRRAAV